MVSWHEASRFKAVVTHGGSDYTFDAHCKNILVMGRENGFDIGTVVLEDSKAHNYISRIDADDAVKIYEQNKGDAAWTTLLSGIIRRAEPLLNVQGNLLKIECDGAGWGLGAMLCADEYGTESSNSGLDTVKTIIEDNGNGIIDAWTNEIFNTGTSSGHNYTTFIEAIAGSISYVYFPYKPAYKAINDVCDIIQAIKGTNAGPHWIVDTSDRFLLTTIGAHSVAGDNPAQYWSTWWRTDQAGSTLVEGVDFADFKFQKLAKAANYVLYHGKFRRPINGDVWTENSHASWGTTGASSTVGSSATCVVDSWSIDCTNVTGAQTGTFFYPSTQDLAFDLTAFGGTYNSGELHFYAELSYVGVAPTMLEVRLWTSAGNYYSSNILAEVTGQATGVWKHFILPVGPTGVHNERFGDFTGWSSTGAPAWTNINAIEFAFTVGGAGFNATSFLVDGLCFAGHVLRGARQAAAFSATDKMKTVLITDQVAKGDTCKAGTPGTTDTGLMARLCKAEYLRQSTTPVIATFTTPIAPDLLPGQMIHCHAKETAGGSYNIDSDYRVLYFTHNVSDVGAVTQWVATSDVKNANPRPLPTQLNVLLGAVRPEFQDRQASSLKTRDIDITQTILEESY